MVYAEHCDLFDVLAYLAFALLSLTREEPVAVGGYTLLADYDYRQKEFVRFVLDHYLHDGGGEVAQEKLPRLIELKYHTPRDGIAERGCIQNIDEVFIGFQAKLYESA